jgi:hypothetical protein
MRFFVEIVKEGGAYVGYVQRDESSHRRRLPDLELSGQSEVEVKGEDYTLRQLTDALINYDEADLEHAFDERGQLQFGQHLFRQIFEWMEPHELDGLREKSVEVRVMTDEEEVARLPWVLLADRGIFLSTVGWSVALSPRVRLKDVELPPSPKILVAMPQPRGSESTGAEAHFEELEEKLSRADQRHTRGKHLRVAYTWDEFVRELDEFQPCIVYYYGHGVGDGHSSRLNFEEGPNHEPYDVPLADFANVLRQTRGGPPVLVYLNCCGGDAGGALGAGRQLGDFIPAVITNSTVAEVEAARAQALAVWHSILLCADGPHVAVASLRGRIGRPLAGGTTQTLADVRWITPVLHCRYDRWHASRPEPPDRLQRDPNWRFKLDRRTQFSQVVYDTFDMLRERKPRTLAYIWYGRQRQGVDLFHQRLRVELKEVHRNALVYEAQPAWPMHIYDHDASFSAMLEEAFSVNRWDDIAGRIRTQNRGEAGWQTLVYLRHAPIDSPKTFDPQKLRSYLTWLNRKFTPTLEKGRSYGVVGVSFVVKDPDAFKAVLDQHIAELDLDSVVFNVLDEMGHLSRKDISDFLKKHNIRLPPGRSAQIIDHIMGVSGGEYEKTLEALLELEQTRWDFGAEVAGAAASAGAAEFDY